MVKVDRHNKDSHYTPTEQKFITIVSDASWCPHTKVWGAGFYVRWWEDKHLQGVSGTYAHSSGDAELKGLYAAIDYVVKHIPIAGAIVVLQCDNLQAINTVDVGKLNAAVYVKRKHIKGHCNNKTNRTFVQEQCDARASKLMHKRRKAHRLNKNIS